MPNTPFKQNNECCYLWSEGRPFYHLLCFGVNHKQLINYRVSILVTEDKQLFGQWLFPDIPDILSLLVVHHTHEHLKLWSISTLKFKLIMLWPWRWYWISHWRLDSTILFGPDGFNKIYFWCTTSNTSSKSPSWLKLHTSFYIDDKILWNSRKTF